MLPNKYIEGIPRVSEIVSYHFPFEGEDEKRFIEWLWSKNISRDKYMEVANSLGTEIHKSMEEYILGHNISSKNNLILNEINYGKEYINSLKDKYPTTEWFPECYCKDKYSRFQGTADLVRINGNKVFIYDYKSYSVAKKYFGIDTKLLKSGRPPKPTKKLEKVSLQLSLYALSFLEQGYEIGGIYLVWVHDTGVYEYEAKLWTKEDLEKLLIKFITKDIKMENIEFKITAPLKIHLQSSPAAYSNISVDLDLKDLDGITPEQAINEAVQLQKKLHNCYISKDLNEG